MGFNKCYVFISKVDTQSVWPRLIWAAETKSHFTLNQCKKVWTYQSNSQNVIPRKVSIWWQVCNEKLVHSQEQSQGHYQEKCSGFIRPEDDTRA